MFLYEFNKFNITGAQTLDSIYHDTKFILKSFWPSLILPCNFVIGVIS